MPEKRFNTIVAEHSDHLEIDVSTEKFPNQIMRIDKEDWESLQAMKIGRVCAGTTGSVVFASCRANGRTTSIHRLLLPEMRMITHINGNRLDNRRKNLEEIKNTIVAEHSDHLEIDVSTEKYPNSIMRIDKEDWEFLLVLGVKIQAKRGYAQCYYKGKVKKVHQLLIPNEKCIDHIDGDGRNNRRNNLRVVTNRQNQQNRHHPKSSVFPGVHFNQGRYVASIRVEGKKYVLGRYRSEDDAGAAYKKAVESIGEAMIGSGIVSEDARHRSNFIQFVENRPNPQTSSGVTGVAWHKRTKRWQSYIKKEGRYIALGYYHNLLDAVAARKSAENKDI